MLILRNDSTDPYFNLACEQYILDNIDEDVFMIWRNQKTVVIGKNQNAYAEIDREYADANGISVARRLSGGGAVFHDLGNVNFSFIIPRVVKEIDFVRFTAPIIERLKALGANAELSGRNDILINGKKVSGNAQCVYNGKVLHHGTLLYSADLSDVSEVLKVDPSKFEGKGIKSVRSRVANIKDIIKCDMDVLEFMAFIQNGFEGEVRDLTECEINAVKSIRDSKFATWEWIWGKSKSYKLNVKQRFAHGSVEAHINTEHGVIKEISFMGDYFGTGDIAELESALVGVKYDPQPLAQALTNLNVEKYIYGSTPQEICKLLFENSLL